MARRHEYAFDSTTFVEGSGELSNLVDPNAVSGRIPLGLQVDGIQAEGGFIDQTINLACP